jgi:hypothetical protein
LDDNLTMLRRRIIDRLTDALADTPAVLVKGARQTGKSTLVQSPELAGKDREYLTFDDPSIMAAAMSDPNGFVAGLETPVTLDGSSSPQRPSPRCLVRVLRYDNAPTGHSRSCEYR